MLEKCLNRNLFNKISCFMHKIKGIRMTIIQLQLFERLYHAGITSKSGVHMTIIGKEKQLKLKHKCIHNHI